MKVLNGSKLGLPAPFYTMKVKIWHFPLFALIINVVKAQLPNVGAYGQINLAGEEVLYGHDLKNKNYLCLTLD